MVPHDSKNDLPLIVAFSLHFSLTDEDVFSQIRQIDYLLSKSRELKLRSRREFEETFDELKEMLAPQTIFAVDDALDQLESVTVQVMQKREELRSRATRYILKNKHFLKELFIFEMFIIMHQN